jgi:hypothetical protein
MMFTPYLFCSRHTPRKIEPASPESVPDFSLASVETHPGIVAPRYTSAAWYSGTAIDQWSYSSMDASVIAQVEPLMRYKAKLGDVSLFENEKAGHASAPDHVAIS